MLGTLGAPCCQVTAGPVPCHGWWVLEPCLGEKLHVVLLLQR